MTNVGRQIPRQRSASEPAPGHVPARPTAAGRRGVWLLVALGGLLGTISAAWQTVDRIAYAGRADAQLICDVNEVLSCSSVFSHWQSSAFGVPNSIIALPVFAAVLFTGLAGLLGSHLSGPYLAGMLGLVLFMAGFITWYLQQSAFAIGVLCLLCAACATSIVLAGVGLTRAAAHAGSFGRGRAGRELSLFVAAGADVVAWLGLALLIAVMLVVGLL